MDLLRRIPVALFVTIIALFFLPMLVALTSSVDVLDTAALPRLLDTLAGRRDSLSEVDDTSAEPLLFLSGRACAQGNCQSWYCDRVILGQCQQRNADGSYTPTNPVGCVGSCGGGNAGHCNSGNCPDGSPYRCCSQPGSGGCGRYIRGVRGSDCCGGFREDDPTPEPTTTPPACDGERIDLFEPRGSYEQDPPYAVVVGQDPTVRGFDLEIDLQGGRAELWRMESRQVCDGGVGQYPLDCPSGPWHWTCVWELQERYNDPIARVEVGMRLADSTVAWIEGDLRARYPGADRSEPLPRVFNIWEGRAMSVSRDWNYLPSDPGVHGGRIIVTTTGTPISDPQQISIPFEVHVHLKDATLWE